MSTYIIIMNELPIHINTAAIRNHRKKYILICWQTSTQGLDQCFKLGHGNPMAWRQTRECGQGSAHVPDLGLPQHASTTHHVEWGHGAGGSLGFDRTFWWMATTYSQVHWQWRRNTRQKRSGWQPAGIVIVRAKPKAVIASASLRSKSVLLRWSKDGRRYSSSTTWKRIQQWPLFSWIGKKLCGPCYNRCHLNN